MSERFNPRVLSYLRAFSRTATVLVSCAGLYLLASPRLDPSLPTISAEDVLTGIGLLVAAGTLALLQDASRKLRFGLVLPALMVLDAVLLLARIGQPAPSDRGTAICLLLLATSLLLVDTTIDFVREALVMVAWFIAYTALLVHVFQPLNLLPRRDIGLSLPMSIVIGALCVGVLALRPERGWVGVVASDSPGGLLLRRVLPVVFFLPLPVSYLRLWGQRSGWYGREFGVAIPAVATALFFLVIVLWTARSLNRLTQQSEALESRLRQTHKMEAVGQLAGGVAHDFNNLLGVMIGYTDLLISDHRTYPDHLHDLQEIRASAEKASSLTRQLLAFSRQQVLQPVVLDLNKVVADNQTLLSRLLPEDIELQFHLSQKPVKVKADRTQIEQVLLNLCVNARDAMPDGGTLIIKTTASDLTASDAPVAPGRYAFLEVCDTGIGMDARTQSRAFDPFFTTKDRQGGAGLGLSTVYGIVDQSNGCVLLSSKPGQGTKFTICLPEVDAPEFVPVLQPAPEVVAGNETVLVVEDSPSLRELFSHSLKMSGYTVLEAGTGDDALRIVDGHAGPIHMLVTDVIMPGMGGRELAAQFKLKRPESRVLYVSGYPDETITRRGTLESGVTLLLKPFGPVEFIRSVRRELDRAS